MSVRLSRESLISPAGHDLLRNELEARLKQLRREIADIEARNPESLNSDLKRARIRLLRAEKSAIHHAANEGLISADTEESIVRDADTNIDELRL